MKHLLSISREYQRIAHQSIFYRSSNTTEISRHLILYETHNVNKLHFVNLLTSELYDDVKLKTTAKSIFFDQKYFFQMLYNISKLNFEGNIFFVPKFSTKYGFIQFSLETSNLIQLFYSDYNSVYMFTVFQEPSSGASIIVIANRNNSTNKKKHNWWNFFGLFENNKFIWNLRGSLQSNPNRWLERYMNLYRSLYLHNSLCMQN